MLMKKCKWLKIMFIGCVLGLLLIMVVCLGKKISIEDEKMIKVGVFVFLIGLLELYGK